MVPIHTNFLLYFYASHYLEWCILYVLHLQLFCMHYYFVHLWCNGYCVWSQHTTVWDSVVEDSHSLIPPAINKTKFIKSSSSQEVYGCSVGQIPHLLWNLMIHDPVDYSPILDLILSQFTPHLKPVFKILLVHACLCWEAYQADSFRFSDKTVYTFVISSTWNLAAIHQQ